MHLTLTAYSSALFSTWFFVEDFGVLFDAGDGVSACSFLDAKTAKRAHANLVEVLESSRLLSLEALVLAHFSSRYTHHDIAEAVLRESRRLELSFPIYAVVPGTTCSDVLRRRPIWLPPVEPERPQKT